MAIGIAVGVLIGIITTIVTLVLLKTALSGSITNAAAVVAITSELLALPTFWFGGPWVTTSLLNLVELSDMINPYIITLVVIYSVMMMYPMIRWIIQMGNTLGSPD